MNKIFSRDNVPEFLQNRRLRGIAVLTAVLAILGIVLSFLLNWIFGIVILVLVGWPHYFCSIPWQRSARTPPSTYPTCRFGFNRASRRR